MAYTFVNYYSLTAAAYASRVTAGTIEPQSFYLTTQTESGVTTKKLYLGTMLLNDADAIAAAVARIAQNESDIAAIQTTLSGLATVATSGAAADVSITDTAGNFSSTDVEGALAELASATGGGIATKTVYMTDNETPGADYVKTYKIYQGSSGSSSSPVQGELIGAINIPKDMVATEGQLVTVTSAGHVIDQAGTDITSTVTGTIPTVAADTLFIMMSVANGDQFFINVEDLIDTYQGSGDVGTVSSGVAIHIANGVVSATVVTLDGTKLDAGSVALAKLATSVQTSLGKADTAVQSVTTGATAGTIAVDGTDIAVYGLAAVATSGDAADVDIADTGSHFTATTVEGALAELATAISGIGTQISTAITTAIEALDSSQTATSGYALTGITQADGVLSAKSEVELTAENISVKSTVASELSASDVDDALTAIMNHIRWQDLT